MLVGRQEGHPACKNWVVGCWRGYLSRLSGWGADLHMAQLKPLPLTISCFSKIQIGFTFLVPAYPGNPGQSRSCGVCWCFVGGVSVPEQPAGGLEAACLILCQVMLSSIVSTDAGHCVPRVIYCTLSQMNWGQRSNPLKCDITWQKQLNCTNYYLFDANFTNFNKTHQTVSEFSDSILDTRYKVNLDSRHNRIILKYFNLKYPIHILQVVYSVQRVYSFSRKPSLEVTPTTSSAPFSLVKKNSDWPITLTWKLSKWTSTPDVKVSLTSDVSSHLN